MAVEVHPAQRVVGILLALARSKAVEPEGFPVILVHTAAVLVAGGKLQVGLSSFLLFGRCDARQHYPYPCEQGKNHQCKKPEAENLHNVEDACK